jgi:hypothetical protein
MPEWLDTIYTLYHLSFISDFMVNMNILVQKIGALHMGPKKQNSVFLEDSSNDFD